MMETGEPVVIRTLAGGAPKIGIFHSQRGRWVTAFVADDDYTDGKYIDVDVSRVEPVPDIGQA